MLIPLSPLLLTRWIQDSVSQAQYQDCDSRKNAASVNRL